MGSCCRVGLLSVLSSFCLAVLPALPHGPPDCPCGLSARFLPPCSSLPSYLSGTVSAAEYLWLNTSPWQKRREGGLCRLPEHSKRLRGVPSPRCASLPSPVAGWAATAPNISKSGVWLS